MEQLQDTNDAAGAQSLLTVRLAGLRTAVEELRQFREIYDKEPTSEHRGYIGFAEMSVVQMAESLIDKTANVK